MGFDCVSPEQFAKGLMLEGGIQNTLVMFGQIKTIETSVERPKNQIKNITKLLDFEFSDGLHVRKNSMIGNGKKIMVESVEPDAIYDFSIVLPGGNFVKYDGNISSDLCRPQKEKLISQRKNGLNPQPWMEPQSEIEPTTPTEPKTSKRLWHCEKELCSMRFLRQSDLLFHNAEGQCSIPVKTQTTGMRLLSTLN